MIQTVAELGVPYILMHARGTSTTMDALAAYPRGTVTEVLDELAALRDRLVAVGVHAENIIFDPGWDLRRVACRIGNCSPPGSCTRWGTEY